MKKKLSLRDVNMILVVVGLVILLAVYFLVFQNYKTKNEELNTQLTERQAHLTELQGYYDNLKSYETGTAEGKANIKSNLSRLPLGIQSEDFLVYIMDSVAEVNGTLDAVTFQDSSQVKDFSTVIDEKQVNVTGYKVGAGFTGTMNYTQLKNYLDNVYSIDNNITYVDSFSVTTDSEASTLSVSFSLSKYYISYEGGEYVPVPVPDVALGTDDPFRTVS